MPYATFAYRVQKTRIVDACDVRIVHKVGYERLVLTACHPLYSAAQRFAVFAKLRRSASSRLGIGSGEIHSGRSEGSLVARGPRLGAA